MAMQILISDEVGQSVRRRATDAGYQEVNEFVQDLLSAEVSSELPSSLSPEQWSRQFKAFLAGLEPGNPQFDDTREGIYADR
jgi:hypothetical protein